MGTLYITKSDCKLQKNGARLRIVNSDNKTIKSVLLKEIEKIILVSKAQISTQLVLSLLEQGTTITYMYNPYKLAGILTPSSTKSTLLLQQARLYDNIEKRTEFVQWLIANKLKEQRRLLSNYASRLKNSYIKGIVQEIKQLEKIVQYTTSIDSLRGLEGIAAKKYFSCFDIIISGSGFSWEGRKKHPAKDPINSMLSFSYTLLANELSLIIKSNGLDAGIGYLHNIDNYRDSLVYDFMELFRTKIVDRMVLAAINLHMVKQEDFIQPNSGGPCYFTDESRAKWYQYFEEYLIKDDVVEDCSFRECLQNAVHNFSMTLIDN